MRRNWRLAPIQAAADAFVEILHDAGVPVTIGYREYQAMVSQSGLAVDLEEGGFTQDGSLTVKLLVAHLPTPLPTRNNTILIAASATRSMRSTANPAQASSNTAWPAAENHHHEQSH